STLIDFIGMPQRRTYVLIDEVQRLENPGLFLKGLYDLGLPIKLLVSGSSSLEMRSKVRESLSGRKRLIRLGGLGWPEFQTAKQGVGDWREFLIYGGYPAVVLADDPSEKRRLLLEYFESYLDRDIDSFLRVDRLDVFRQLIRLLGFQTGSLVNLNELAGSCQVSRDTMSRYLSYLEETFVVRRLEPFSRNPRKEISKMPKVFFADCGWRNLVSAGFTEWDERTDRGGILESAVEQWLRDRFPLASVHFWRSQAKAEVDFVVDDGGQLHAYEVKASRPSRPTVSRSLRSFVKSYRPASATLINLALDDEVDVEGLTVRFASFPGCLLE
ncbi:MAG: ATP-binding protein, partial [Proteobacteria bacterium]|nr:ATP-binding protein [Pseudomonadota bacterium]